MFYQLASGYPPLSSPTNNVCSIEKASLHQPLTGCRHITGCKNELPDLWQFKESRSKDRRQQSWWRMAGSRRSRSLEFRKYKCSGGIVYFCLGSSQVSFIWCEIHVKIQNIFYLLIFCAKLLFQLWGSNIISSCGVSYRETIRDLFPLLSNDLGLYLRALLSVSV